MTLPCGRSQYLRFAFVILMFAFSAFLYAEQMTVAVSSSENFSIVNSSASSAGSPAVTVNYSSASLTSGHRLVISVKAGSANFSTSSGSAIPATDISWTVAGASGGSGSSGTLSSSSWTQVYLSNTNPTSGSISLNFSLAAPGSGVTAATQNLQLQWQFVSQ
jgi:hypothetical protein